MGVRLLAAERRHTTPWRNGAGTTTQVAAGSQPSAGEDLGWRISIATIAASGPFSDYAGVDRVITLLRASVPDPGGSLALVVDGRANSLERFVPHAFSGDSDVSAVLRGGQKRALNVMTRRAIWEADVDVSAPLTSSLPLSGGPPGHPTVVVVLDGSADLVGSNGTVTLGDLDAAALSGSEPLWVVPREDSDHGPARLAVVRLHAVG